MLSDAEFKAQRARNGMGESDPHQRVVDAIKAAVHKAGVRNEHLAAAVAGAVLAGKLVKVEADGEISWAGPHGWDLESALPGYLARPENRWIKDKDRELAGQATTATPNANGMPTREEIGRALIAQLAPPAPKTMSKQELGEALVRAAGNFEL